MQRAILLVALLVVLAAAPHGAAQPGVRVTRFTLNGFPERHTPPQYNRAIVVRHAFAGARPNAIVVLLPGLGGGASSLDLFARSLLERLGPGAEVWVHERRSNLLEDHTGLLAGLAARSPDFATGYYFGGLAVEGRQFREIGVLPFTGYWGLDAHLRDLRAVVREARRTGARVFLGGHSLGAVLTALYAAYDFGDGPGYADLDGMILLDGAPGLGFPPTPELLYLSGVRTPAGSIPGVRALEAGEAVPYLSDEDHNPTNSRLFETLALAATYAPEARFVLPNEVLRSVPVSNVAALGITLDDETQVSYTLRARVGRPAGTFDRVRDPRGLNRTGFIVVPTLRPLPGSALVGWTPYDRMTPPELVDLREVAEAVVTPLDDFTEWYTPWRLLLDVAFATNGGTAVTRHFPLTRQRQVNRPLIAIGAGVGFVRERLIYQRYVRQTATTHAAIRILPEYAHLDVVLAHRNDAAIAVADWIRALLQ